MTAWGARPGGARPWLLGGLALAGLAGLLALALAGYTLVELRRFEQLEARRSLRIFAAGQALAPGVHVDAVDLAGTLARLRYVETRGAPAAPGQFRRSATRWEIHARWTAETPGPTRLTLELAGGRIAAVRRDGEAVPRATLEPELLAGGDDRPGEDHRPVRLAEVPPALVRAVLAAEDHRFFEHGGLDARGLVRAAWANLRAGRVTQGGSTITQQLVKNRLLGSRRTLWRKLREAWLAAILEWRYPKAQILEAYLNEVYLGQRGALAIRGVGAAARAYFGKEIHALTVGEAALLAGMIRAPNSYSPVLNPERARQRRDAVLARMDELGALRPAEVAAARAEPVRVRPAAVAGPAAPYFVDLVRVELEQRLGAEWAQAEGRRLHTTLDPALQRFAELAVRRGLAALERRRPRLARREPGERLEAVLVAVDPATGAIRALVGGRDYGTSQFNRALHARRQPGSAFKPIVYLAALGTRGGPPAFTAASLVDDSPLTLVVDGRPWSPRNYEDRYEGRVSVRRALEQSLNAATVRIGERVGWAQVVATARALGLTSPLAPVPAVVLGAFEVTPLELARAYVPLANGGWLPAALTTLAAADDGGGAPAPLAPARTAVISPAEAYLMTSLLEGVITAGTGAAAAALAQAAPVAGKTGTTNEGRDAWFVGYTPTLLALVWVGFDSGEPHGLSGAEAALPIWADFMQQALAAYPPGARSVPPGVSVVEIDATNGKRARAGCPLVIRETFLTGTEPPPCDEHGNVGERLLDWWRRLRDWFLR